MNRLMALVWTLRESDPSGEYARRFDEQIRARVQAQCALNSRGERACALNLMAWARRGGWVGRWREYLSVLRRLPPPRRLP